MINLFDLFWKFIESAAKSFFTWTSEETCSCNLVFWIFTIYSMFCIKMANGCIQSRIFQLCLCLRVIIWVCFKDVFFLKFYSFDKKNIKNSGFVQLFGPWCITQLFCIIRGRGPCWGFQYALWCSKRCLNFPNLLFNPLNEAKLLI